MSQTILHENIQRAISDYKRQAAHRWNIEHAKRATMVILKSKLAIKESMTKAWVKKSWEKLGVNQDFSINVQQVLQQYKIQALSLAHSINLIGNLPEANNHMKNAGRVTDKPKKDLFTAAACISTKVKGRDQLAISNQQCILLSHYATFDREQKKKATAKEKLEIALSRRQAKAENKKSQTISGRLRTARRSSMVKLDD